MSRSKTGLRHIDSQGKIHRVTKNEEGKFFIGNSDERAEGKMCHYSQLNRSNGGGTYGNPFIGTGNGEWDYYAHSADDL